MLGKLTPLVNFTNILFGLFRFPFDKKLQKATCKMLVTLTPCVMSPTFYNWLLCPFPFDKKLQTQTESIEKLCKKFCLKKMLFFQLFWLLIFSFISIVE